MSKKMMSKIKEMFNKNQNWINKLGWKMISTVVITLTAVVTFVVYAAFTEPTTTPANSDQDFSQNILGADNADNDFSSSIVTANNDGSIIERLEYLSNVISSSVLPIDKFNGSAGDSVDDYAFYTQEKGGVDDYNNNSGGGSMPADSYSASWTQCDAGDNYCDTGDSTACSGGICYINNDTGLIWSDYLDSGTNHTWFWANNCYEPGTAENPGTCVAGGDDACQCVKKTSSETGCEALGDGNWKLPYQKELMQAYIDGSWGNLPHAGNNFWSATTGSHATQVAWRVHLYFGYVVYPTKTNTYYSRCVRR